MVEKEYSCDCGDNCKNKLTISYHGIHYIHFPKKFDKISEEELYDLGNLLVGLDIDSNKLFNTTKGYKAFNNISMDKVPELIKCLQEVYGEYQQVLEILKKQGKLESLAQDNKLNLSEQSNEKKDGKKVDMQVKPFPKDSIFNKKS